MILFDTKENANIFKNFFSNLAESLLKKLPCRTNRFGLSSVEKYYKDKLNGKEKFKFQEVSESSVEKLLKEIDTSKATGIDQIPAKFLKDAAPVISVHITKIINLSIKTETFPSECKIAKLKPLYKKGAKTEPENYRPISLLPLISKIIEKSIHDQLLDHLTKSNLLYTHQSGFRANHSTDTCLSQLTNMIINGVEKGKHTGMILIDLQKAFDTLNHEILLGKMKCIGLSESSVRWFRSYLAERTFFVSLDNTLSEPGRINCGVPQGSILGPLLFLLYINDVPQALSKCTAYLYADDTGISYQHTDITDIENILNTEFASICEWFVDNKLSIHFGEDKTKCVLFSRKKSLPKLNISYKDNKIRQYDTVEYLGCLLDSNLNGESMATKVLKKINTKLQFLYRQNKFLNKELRRLLCNSLIQPHFDYACASWYPLVNQNFKKKLQITQNKCIRFCLGLQARHHVGANEFRQINWLPVKERAEQRIATSVFKYWKGTTPSYFNELFVPSPNRYNTRLQMALDIPLRKSNIGQKNLSFLGPSVWNKLPSNLKKMNTTNSFTHGYKKMILNEMK